MDDRMEAEDQKALANALMGQSQVTESVGPSSVGTGHPDKEHIANLFGDSPHATNLHESSPQTSGFNLSALSKLETPSAQPVATGTIREDLVQQAAQALVRDQTDAYLAITHRMNPDEVDMTLQTARTWRRADQDWQGSFSGAKESGFKFMDRKPPKGKKNKAEALAQQIAGFMTENGLGRELAPTVTRKILGEQGINVGVRRLALFSNRVADMVVT